MNPLYYFSRGFWCKFILDKWEGIGYTSGILRIRKRRKP